MDAKITKILKLEKEREKHNIELIASEKDRKSVV